MSNDTHYREAPSGNTYFNYLLDIMHSGIFRPVDIALKNTVSGETIRAVYFFEDRVNYYCLPTRASIYPTLYGKATWALTSEG